MLLKNMEAFPEARTVEQLNEDGLLASDSHALPVSTSISQ